MDLLFEALDEFAEAFDGIRPPSLRVPAEVLRGALDNLEFTADELAAIDEHAVDGGIDLWQGARRSRD